MALSIIIALYISIGVLAAIGAAVAVKKLVPAGIEPALFGGFLIAIAAFYLAFTAYFGNQAAWLLESQAVMVFALLGVGGIRWPALLIAGYLLHGGWDLLHELHAHHAFDAWGGRAATEIPLAYGAFCSSFDFCMAAYFMTRRAVWSAARP